MKRTLFVVVLIYSVCVAVADTPADANARVEIGKEHKEKRNSDGQVEVHGEQFKRNWGLQICRSHGARETLALGSLQIFRS